MFLILHTKYTDYLVPSSDLDLLDVTLKLIGIKVFIQGIPVTQIKNLQTNMDEILHTVLIQ